MDWSTELTMRRKDGRKKKTEEGEEKVLDKRGTDESKLEAREGGIASFPFQYENLKRLKE